MRILIKTLTFIILMSKASIALCYTGSEGGGAGTIVTYEEQRVFLDLLMIPSLREKVINESKKTLRSEGLSSTSALKKTFLSTQTLLQKWNNQVFSMTTNSILTALKSNNWKMIKSFESINHKKYYIEKSLSLKIKNPETVAYYIPLEGDFKVEISSKKFKELSSRSRTGVFLHEAIRHAQISGVKGNKYFGERALQEATSIYTLCKTNPVLSMYINHLFYTKYSDIEKEYFSFKVLIKDYCDPIL